MNSSRTWAIAKKEFFHIYRDPRSLALVILMPALLMLLFGYAVTLDVKKVSMAVLDRDRTQESLNFIQRFSASPYFRLRFWVRDEKEMKRLIDQGEVKMGLVLPWNFSKTIKAEKVVPIQALIDGADANTANIILSYAQAIARQYTQEKTILKVSRMGIENLNLPIEARPRVWFNEDSGVEELFRTGTGRGDHVDHRSAPYRTGDCSGMGEGDDGTPHLYSCSKRRTDDGKAVPLFFLRPFRLVLGRPDGQMGLSGAVERKCRPAFCSLLHLHFCGPGPWLDHFHLCQDTASGQSDGYGHRISAHLPPLRVHLLDRQHARLAPDHYLRDCTSVLCDDPERDLLEGGGLLLPLA